MLMADRGSIIGLTGYIGDLLSSASALLSAIIILHGDESNDCDWNARTVLDSRFEGYEKENEPGGARSKQAKPTVQSPIPDANANLIGSEDSLITSEANSRDTLDHPHIS